MSYGSLTPTDVKVLEDVLLVIAAAPAVKVLEIGIHTGQTARGINQFLTTLGCLVDYWCVDNGQQSDLTPPFEGANMVKGDSSEVFGHVPFGLDVALIDGCHCGNHVILDTIHYSARVRVGGFLIFHDCAPHVQQTMRDPHGPDVPWFYNSVVAAHEVMGFPTKEWELLKEAFDPASAFGGMKAFRKL